MNYSKNLCFLVQSTEHWHWEKEESISYCSFLVLTITNDIWEAKKTMTFQNEDMAKSHPRLVALTEVRVSSTVKPWLNTQPHWNHSAQLTWDRFSGQGGTATRHHLPGEPLNKWFSFYLLCSSHSIEKTSRDPKKLFPFEN